MRVQELQIPDRGVLRVLQAASGMAESGSDATSLAFSDGITVLFGANSAGKTTVLEAIDSLLNGRSDFLGPRRSVPGESSIGDRMRLVVRFDQSNPMEGLLHNRWLLEATSAKRAPDVQVPDDTVIEALVGAGEDGASTRRVLAREVLGIGRWALDDISHWVVVESGDLSPDALEAAARVATREDIDLYCQTFFKDDLRPGREWQTEGGDLLGTIATEVVATGRAEVRTPAWGDLMAQLREAGFRLVNIPLAAEDVHRVAHDAIIAAYRLVARSAVFDDDDVWAGLLVQDRPRVVVESMEAVLPSEDGDGEHRIEFTQVWRKPAKDPWLVITGSEDDEEKTFIVNPLLLKLTQVLGRRMAALCPSFVLELGRPSIIVTDPRSWTESPHRVEVVLETEVGNGESVPRSVDSFGAGTRRWVQGALALTAASLPEEFTSWDDDFDEYERTPDGRLIPSREVLKEWVERYGGNGPVDRRLIDLEDVLTLGNAFLLVDEPEAHLHPAAAASVAQWLLQISPEVAGAVLATHSKDILALDSALVKRVLVKSPTHFIPLLGALASELAADADTLGLTQADLLLLRRGVVFVEGPHDVAVLEEWIGGLLSAAGVRLLPAHGTRSLKGLLESELVGELGLRMGVLTDNTNVQAIVRRRPRSEEENILYRICQEAWQVGREVQPFGLSKRDIAQYLPDDICAAAARAFPGWEKAVNACRARSGNVKDLKAFITREYGLALDRRSVRTLARTTALADRVPQEIKKLGREIEAWATGFSISKA